MWTQVPDKTLHGMVTLQLPLPKPQTNANADSIGLVASAYLSQQSLVIADAHEDNRFNKEAEKTTGYRTQSMLCFPIVRMGKVRVVLQAINKLKRPTFDEDDIFTLQLLGHVASEVLHVCESQTSSVSNDKRKDQLLLRAKNLVSCETPVQLVHGVIQGLQDLFEAEASALHLVYTDHTSHLQLDRQGKNISEVVNEAGFRGLVGQAVLSRTTSAYHTIHKDTHHSYDRNVDLPLPIGRQSVVHTIPFFNGNVASLVCQFVCKEKERTGFGDDGNYNALNSTHVKLLNHLVGYALVHIERWYPIESRHADKWVATGLASQDGPISDEDDTAEDEASKQDTEKKNSLERQRTDRVEQAMAKIMTDPAETEANTESPSSKETNPESESRPSKETKPEAPQKSALKQPKVEAKAKAEPKVEAKAKAETNVDEDGPAFHAPEEKVHALEEEQKNKDEANAELEAKQKKEEDAAAVKIQSKHRQKEAKKTVEARRKQLLKEAKLKELEEKKQAEEAKQKEDEDKQKNQAEEDQADEKNTKSANTPPDDFPRGPAFRALEEKVRALEKEMAHATSADGSSSRKRLSRKESVEAIDTVEQEVQALKKEMAQDTSSADDPAIDKDGPAFHALEEKVEALKRSSKEIPQSTSDDNLAVPRQKSKESNDSYEDDFQDEVSDSKDEVSQSDMKSLNS